MEKPEIKKKHIPGTRELYTQIKQITDDINALEGEIKSCQDKIHTIVLHERNASPKAKFLSELKELKETVESIRGERRNYQNLINEAKGKIDSLRSSVSHIHGGYDSIEKINTKLEELELRLISSTITAKEENEIASNMANLNSQKNKLSEMENNLKTIKSLEASVSEYKAKLGELSKELGLKLAMVDNVKSELDKLAETTKEKSPEIVKLENKISALKTQKSELAKVRNSKREKIHSMEEEYSKFEAELLIQKSLEDQKDVLRKNINSLKAEKDSLLNEQSAYDPKIYDSLIYSFNKVKKSGVFNLDIDLVTHLMKNNIPIPNSIESVDNTIALLQKKKQESIESFEGMKSKASKALAEIDAKIEAETEKLNALPQTNYEILKKGNIRPSFKSKV